MINDPYVVRKGAQTALSPFLAICIMCFFSALISCSSSFSAQESLVRKLFEAAKNRDVGRAMKLMPRLSLLNSEQQKTALDNLSRIGAYKITGSKREDEGVIVMLQYSLGSDVMILSIPVRKEGESWVIGDDFRVRRSLQSETFERRK